jgi:hypothetical protein
MLIIDLAEHLGAQNATTHATVSMGTTIQHISEFHLRFIGVHLRRFLSA